jgi:hypothetical protein
MPQTRHSSFVNYLSLGGAVLAVVSAVVFLVFFIRDLTGAHTNPYFGIVTFLFLPALFVAGLVLIPIGIVRTRRRAEAAGGPGGPDWPTIDLRSAPTRRIVLVVLVMTFVNITIIALAAYQSLDFVDSRTFCTGVCHTPMEPQAVAHQRSVHASISCSSCHVGQGPPGFLRAKLGGVRRLAAVATGDYQRPIPSPVSDLPAAVETCQRCHNREKYFGELIRRVHYYSDDETNTEQITTLAMQAGGGGWEVGGPHGIHWHASPQTQVEYIATDASRQTIPWIRVTDGRGRSLEYVTEGVTPEQLAQGERRIMDCADCHNRQGHALAITVDRAVDDALARGLIPRTLPFARREVLAALQDIEGDRASVERRIAERLSAFYSKSPDGGAASGPQIAQAIAAAQRVYTANVFPSMNVKWGVYPTNLGHTDSPGCFRCHDDQHKTTTGAVVSQDCEKCHKLQ